MFITHATRITRTSFAIAALTAGAALGAGPASPGIGDVTAKPPTCEGKRVTKLGNGARRHHRGHAEGATAEDHVVAVAIEDDLKRGEIVIWARTDY